jgi:addiction module HigA family antidote
MPLHKTTAGEILLYDFFARSELNVESLAEKSGLNPLAIENLIHNHISVSDVIAEGLAKGTGKTKEFWLDIQKANDEKK